MSRGFVKEDDAQTPPLVPPRAALPPGTPNYVTPTGLEQLRQELVLLEAERAAAEADRANDTDRTFRLSLLNGRLALLAERLASARLVDPTTQPPGEVRFGATVRLRGQGGAERVFTLVGVDEADVAAGKIGFVAPLARVLIGARSGQVVALPLGGKREEVEVLGVSYDG
ncbi:transcription elongation factor GreAB [Hymenobacter sp. RP-2-7]|uniref:Transcription elongation factor GreAB n=1 Tax=Hymenobacter polaris TaxID=2682546 RepID=A0A7Y0FN11_9BACT|nr:GreA/GreB family elongation factor [Hymenobacter polaris]NML66448.1 transcription elongation factor GreAB [Hymenobacter polaris]